MTSDSIVPSADVTSKRPLLRVRCCRVWEIDPRYPVGRCGLCGEVPKPRPWPGFCQACGAALNPPHATSCRNCHASDTDE